jgi:hypothetical protein
LTRGKDPLFCINFEMSRASLIDRLAMNGHSSAMSKRVIIAGLIRALFSVTLLVSLILYPPSSAHAHAAAHGLHGSVEPDAGHHGHGDHAHHATGADSTAELEAADAPNCCKGICIAAVFPDVQSGFARMTRATHAVAVPAGFLAVDPMAHLRPPQDLI